MHGEIRRTLFTGTQIRKRLLDWTERQDLVRLNGTAHTMPQVRSAGGETLAGAQSPTVRRRRLALELRRLREAAKLTCEEVAERLECSASKISRVETGRVSVSPRDVRDMLEIYGASEELRESLVQLARESRQKGWWHAYGDTVQPQFATYLGMESAASEIRIYKVNRIPGLLQTEDYARAAFTAGMVGSPKQDVERQVALQMERQRLSQADPPRVWTVLDEAALRRQVGGPEVMRVQLEHLLELSALPNVSLQVIPFSGGAHPAMDLPFVILVFPERSDTDVVCVGYPTGALWIEDMTEVDKYNRYFNHLQAAALSFEDSASMTTSVLKER
jgi:transcriptional regulator with XRE-family HTH domain